MSQSNVKQYIRVALNGTSFNRYQELKLKFNPFPQIADAHYTQACLRLQELGGEPIPDVDYIRQKLKGFSDEFVDLCCRNFKKGEYVEFIVFWSV